MKISTLLAPLLASLLRPEATDSLGVGDRPAPLRRTDSGSSGTERATRSRLADLRFPILPPPLS